MRLSRRGWNGSPPRRWACAEGLRRTGEGGLLSRLTKMVVESALEGEMGDRDGSFTPQLVRKRQRRLSGLDGLVISRVR